MYEISNSIKEQEYNGLQVQKLAKTDSFEILHICLEKGSVFPEHTSPTDAQLIMLEGEILFHIAEKTFHLKKHEHFNFPEGEAHSVDANENSKFLILR